MLLDQKGLKALSAPQVLVFKVRRVSLDPKVIRDFLAPQAFLVEQALQVRDLVEFRDLHNIAYHGQKLLYLCHKVKLGNAVMTMRMDHLVRRESQAYRVSFIVRCHRVISL